MDKLHGYTVKADTTEGWENRITIKDRNLDSVSIAVDPGAELDEVGVDIRSRSPYGYGGPEAWERIGLIAEVTIREFMGGIGFLPDPAESGTWYADGSACLVSLSAIRRGKKRDRGRVRH